MGAVPARVARRRLAVLAKTYRDAGLTGAEGRHEALLAYTAYMGRAFAPEGTVTAAYAHHLAARLVP